MIIPNPGPAPPTFCKKLFDCVLVWETPGIQQGEIEKFRPFLAKFAHFRLRNGTGNFVRAPSSTVSLCPLTVTIVSVAPTASVTGKSNAAPMVQSDWIE